MSDDTADESAGGPASEDSSPDPDATEATAAGSDRRRESAPDGSTDADPAGSEASSDDAPLSDLARRVGRRSRERNREGSPEPTPDLDPELSEGSPPDPDEDPFDRMSVGEIDEETLWSSLGSDGASADIDADVGTVPLGDVEPASGVESVGDAGSEAREHVVPKDKYCQSCPYLDEPPALACTHEGTEIVAVVDNERFRVRNCPMVEGGVEPKQ